MAQTGGVKPMSIAGRMALERERMLGMSDGERAWRKKWVEDQVLHRNEPIFLEEYWMERVNPIRRFYRKPLDLLFTALIPRMGSDRAHFWRFMAGKWLMLGFGVLSAHYYFKYAGNDWTKKGGWRVTRTKPTVFPGQEGFPFKSKRVKPGDYANRGFKFSPI